MWTRRGLVWLLLLVTLFTAGQIDAKKSSSSSGKGDDVKAGAKEPVIEEVTSKQLERLLNDKDFVAVFWCECRRNMKFILNWWDKVDFVVAILCISDFLVTSVQSKCVCVVYKPWPWCLEIFLFDDSLTQLDFFFILPIYENSHNSTIYHYLMQSFLNVIPI